MFCGYHLLCIKLLIDKTFLFSTYSISPSFVCKGSIFSCLPPLCFYCLKLPLFMLWGYYQIEVAMVVFIEFSPLNSCFNFLTSYSEKELQCSDSVYYFTQSFVYFCLFFSSGRVPFSISCKAGLVLMNSCSFCLSRKAFVSPSYLNDNFFRYTPLGWQVLSFKILSMSFHSLLWSFCWEIC